MVSHSFSCTFLSPSFPPPALWVSLFPLVEGQHLFLHTHTHTCALCSSGSCELQCCSLIQGKCQTQEKVFKYRHFQRFSFLSQPRLSPRTTRRQAQVLHDRVDWATLAADVRRGPSAATPDGVLFHTKMLRALILFKNAPWHRFIEVICLVRVSECAAYSQPPAYSREHIRIHSGSTDWLLGSWKWKKDPPRLRHCHSNSWKRAALTSLCQQCRNQPDMC